MKFLWYFSIIFVISLISKFSCRKLYAKQNHLIGVYGGNVTANFVQNLTSGESLQLFKIYYDGNLNNELASGSVSTYGVVNNPPESVRNRLTASYIAQEKTFTLTLSNLTLNDTHDFDALVFYIIGNNPTPFLGSANVTMETRGGPFECGSSLPSFINTTEGWTNVTVTKYLCGNPRPGVLFSIENNNVNANVDITDMGFHTYKYIATLPQISPSMCGEKVYFSATGHEGKVTDESTLQVQFDAPSVTISESYNQKNNCTYVKWDTVNIGKCTGLQYQIDYVTNGASIATFNISMATSNHSFCVNDSSINITLVRLRTLYNDMFGVWNTYVPTTPPPPPITTTLTPAPQSDDDDDMLYIIIGAVAGGLLLILLIILIIYCCCARKKKQERKQSTQAHVVKSRDETLRPQVEMKPDSLPRSSGMGIANEGVIDETEMKPPAEEKLSQVPPIAIKDKDDNDVVYVSQIRYYDPNEFGMEDSYKNVPTSMRYNNGGDKGMPYKHPNSSIPNEAYVSDDSDTPSSNQYPSSYKIDHSIDDVTEMIPETV